MLIRFAVLLIIGSVTSSCTHSIAKFYPEIVPSKSDAKVVVGDGDSHLNIIYLGCGNMVLEKNGEGIMTDPFFSNQPLLKMLGKIQSDPKKFNTWKSNLEYFLSPSVVKVGLVSHSHYDHLMDLPLLVEQRYFTNMNRVYGNSYMPLMMQNFADEKVGFQSLNDEQVFNPTVANDSEYGWIEVSQGIRFLPILANHAPHVGKKLFMNKPLNAQYFDDHLIYSTSKTKAFKWPTGESYSFLVDFIDRDTLRVFVQTSASQPPYGFPPQAELTQKEVDLAIICYASSLNVDNHPKALVDYVRPKKVIFVHWEDFFRSPKSFNDQRLVRGTNPKKVHKRINEMSKPASFFTMPKPGTRIDVRY